MSGVVAPTLTIADPASVTVTWTVGNQGTGVGRTTEWTDAVFVSPDAILGNGDELLLARFSHSGAVAAGDSYTRSETFLLPPAFQGRYTLFVRTDVDGPVFENGIEGNNAAAASGFFDVMTIPYADLVVDAVTPETPAYSGQDLAITWVVRNQGIGLTNTYNWGDLVFLATNPDGSDRTPVASFDHIGFLAPGGTYTRTGRITLPDGIEGTYYAFVQTGGPFEFVYTDNNSRMLGAHRGAAHHAAGSRRLRHRRPRDCARGIGHRRHLDRPQPRARRRHRKLGGPPLPAEIRRYRGRARPSAPLPIRARCRRA